MIPEDPPEDFDAELAEEQMDEPFLTPQEEAAEDELKRHEEHPA